LAGKSHVLATRHCGNPRRGGSGLCAPQDLANVAPGQRQLQRWLRLCDQGYGLAGSAARTYSDRGIDTPATPFLNKADLFLLDKFRLNSSGSKGLPLSYIAEKCPISQAAFGCPTFAVFPIFFLDFHLPIVTIRPSFAGLFSVPAPLFDELARSSAGFFVWICCFAQRPNARQEIAQRRQRGDGSSWRSLPPSRLCVKKILSSPGIFVAFTFAFPYCHP